MKTKITRNGDTTVIEIDGRLDVEVQDPLRESLNRIVSNTRTDSVPKKIIFDMQNLEFVGSSGISTFVQTLKDINARAAIKPKYANVRSEFQKIIKAFDDEAGFEFFDDVENARRSFDN